MYAGIRLGNRWPVKWSVIGHPVAALFQFGGAGIQYSGFPIVNPGFIIRRSESACKKADFGFHALWKSFTRRVTMTNSNGNRSCRVFLLSIDYSHQSIDSRVHFGIQSHPSAGSQRRLKWTRLPVD